MLRLFVAGTLTAVTALCQTSSPPAVAVTPEPATFGLMALGLAAVGVSAWRQKRKREK